MMAPAGLRMQRLLIILGVLVLLAGLFWPWLKQVPLGRLPGDLVIPLGESGRLYLPITTMLLISVVVSLLIRLFR